jgi:hypothetical protein
MIDHITPDELAALRARHEAANLPWSLSSTGTEILSVYGDQDYRAVTDTNMWEREPTERELADAALIVAAVNALPRLLDALANAEARAARGEARFAGYGQPLITDDDLSAAAPSDDVDVSVNAWTRHHVAPPLDGEQQAQWDELRAADPSDGDTDA